MLPVFLAAEIIPLPPGMSSSSIFSPGFMPKCRSTSFLNVTCPRSVTVKIAIATPSEIRSKSHNKVIVMRFCMKIEQ
jgi:hypothetical protein